ncbi:MAG: hypothetical protein INR68_17570 [Methylobacterium mesophilicum]|nr:hypothetical protein [Methylobacterium mesophilicum]
MRKILGAALAVALSSPCAAADRYLLRQDQSGLTLPGVTLPQGYDEVHASDGTTCRTSNGGAGAYADVGVIGSNNDAGVMDAGSVYGRLVIPLGVNGTRVDCRRLYDLEIQRLQMEVRLLKAGLDRGATGSIGKVDADANAVDQAWADAPAQVPPSSVSPLPPVPPAAAPVRPRVRKAPSAASQLRGSLTWN